jgi:hypothetical protein
MPWSEPLVLLGLPAMLPVTPVPAAPVVAPLEPPDALPPMLLPLVPIDAEPPVEPDVALSDAPLDMPPPVVMPVVLLVAPLPVEVDEPPEMLPPEVPPSVPDVDVPEPVLPGEAAGLETFACASRLQASKSAWVGCDCANARPQAETTLAAVTSAVMRVDLSIGVLPVES